MVTRRGLPTGLRGELSSKWSLFWVRSRETAWSANKSDQVLAELHSRGDTFFGKRYRHARKGEWQEGNQNPTHHYLLYQSFNAKPYLTQFLTSQTWGASGGLKGKWSISDCLFRRLTGFARGAFRLVSCSLLQGLGVNRKKSIRDGRNLFIPYLQGVTNIHKPGFKS